MKSLSAAAADRAGRFVRRTARLIDRHRFALHFHGGPPGAVLAALRPYENPDGGYGHALEPDLRGEDSQPVPAQHALQFLHEAGADDDPAVTRIADHLAAVARPDGGVPFVLPTPPGDPHAPWWTTGQDPPSAVNPTATLAGMLHRAGATHPWTAAATDYCWDFLESDHDLGPYDGLAVLTFLDHVPDRERAETAFERHAGALRAAALGDANDHLPLLDFAPAPGGFGARLFPAAELERALDAAVDAQREDGGWTFAWPAWTPAVEPEWRGFLTVERLLTLRAYERIQG